MKPMKMSDAKSDMMKKRMGPGMHSGMDKGSMKQYIFISLFVIFTIASYSIGFRPGLSIYSNFQSSFIEMITFVPFIFILVGLFDAWVPKEKVEKHIGEESGIKGIFLVILLAMLQAGPLYGAFPVAYILYRKKASIRNIFIYLGAFSTLKLPMLGMELGYLGMKFMIVKTLVSLPFFIAMGFLLERMLKKEFKVNEVKG